MNGANEGGFALLARLSHEQNKGFDGKGIEYKEDFIY